MSVSKAPAAMLSLTEARARILEEVRRLGRATLEEVGLGDAVGRVLAADVASDRDQPPFDRSTRDGFAARAGDGARLRVIGELAAGGTWDGAVGPGECVEIMTGAAVPRGADAVIMVEHTRRDGAEVVCDRAVSAGENVVAAGSEARRGDLVLRGGARIDHASVAMLASVGRARVPVFARPRVAIVGTGDELVEVEATPSEAQIRNSNSWSLAAQAVRAGATPVRMPIARDDEAALRASIEAGLAAADVLVLSGGVSMGKYDLVEGVLGELGARVLFDAVAIRPGKPAVAGIVRGKPFFALPGNPLSTTLTFELLARPAIEAISGATTDAGLPVMLARMAEVHRARAVDLTVFCPATMRGGEATIVRSQGSGDIAALARADVWVVVPPGVTELPAGAIVEVLPK